MKEDYNKKKNMNQSCNLETAEFINEISIEGNYQYGEDKSPINYYEYYCVLKDGTILNFYKSKNGLFDSKQKFKKGNLYETKLIDGKTYSNGGRVLNIVIRSNDFKSARDKALSLLKNLDWKSGFYRKDIGHKVIDQ